MNLFNTIGDALGTILGFILWFFFDLFDSFVPAVFIFVVIIKAISFPFELKNAKSYAKKMQKSVQKRRKYKKNMQITDKN